VTALPALRPIVLTLSSFLVALLIAGPAQGQPSDAPAASPTVEALSLTPGASQEREIRGGETQSFNLPLDAGTFLFLEISPRNVSLSFRLLSHNGETLSEAEGIGPDLLAAITDREGIYRLEAIAPKEQRGAKRFTVKILNLRTAEPEDRARVRGAQTLAAARRLTTVSDEELRRRAETLLAESVAAWQAAGDARGGVEALLERGSLQEERGDAEGALVWYEKARNLALESGFVEGEARALSAMGFCNSRLARHDVVIDLYKQSLQIWRQIGGPYEQASALQRLGRAYERKKDFAEALRTFSEALSFAEKSGDLAQQGRALSSIGASHYSLGRPGEAREIWENALDLSRRGDDPETEFLLENNLAVLYHNQGQFQRAVELYTRLADYASLQEPGLLRSNLGQLYLEMGNPEKALKNYDLARAAYHALGDIANEADALVGIGRAHQRMGDPRTALAEFEKARQMLPQVPWSVFHSMGLAQIELGRSRDALSTLEKALGIAQETQDLSRQTATLLALGSAYSKLRQPDASAEMLEKAIATGSEIGYQSAIAEALLQRALLRRDQGRFEEGLADTKRALEIIESARRNIPGDQLRIGFFAIKRNYYDLQTELLMQLDQSHPGMYKAQALETSERARGRALLDLLAEGRIDLSQGLGPDLRRREDDLFDRISRAQGELRSGKAKPERIQEVRAELKMLDDEREQLDQEIRSRNRRYAEVRYPSPLTLDGIQNRILDENTALLEYALGEKRSILFVITRQAINTYDLPAAEEILQRVRPWRTSLERESLLTRRGYLELAFQLYRDLLEPAVGALAGKTNLLIVPDGALYYIPFEALLTEPAGDRPFRDLPSLLRRYSISYSPSASVLAGLREPRQEPVPADRKQVAIFAPFAKPGSGTATRGPAGSSLVPDASRWSFEPLPASQREVSGIAGLYPGAALSFVGDEATEGAITHNLAVANARRLHFATHAQIDERYPEHSALVLAEGAGDDGLLQVYEIFNLKLSADLAVLSACQTALGKEVTGEGLVGLSRAFFYAGVPSLVVSLWNVVDGPTPDLMLDFYMNLDRLKNKAKALQVAKLSMVDRGVYSHPSFWAPFILLGEPR
jgi:CHAT domain-containing protein/Tfp pilus assembly protein PilF